MESSAAEEGNISFRCGARDDCEVTDVFADLSIRTAQEGAGRPKVS